MKQPILRKYFSEFIPLEGKDEGGKMVQNVGKSGVGTETTTGKQMEFQQLCKYGF